MTESKNKKQLERLLEEVKSVDLPSDLVDKATREIQRLDLAGQGEWFWRGLDQLQHWINWIISLPWNKKSQDVLDLKFTEETLNKGHYGLDRIKQRILEFLSVLILQEKREQKRVVAPVLCLVGLVGTGKTTMAKSISKALGREFVRIPFGGLGDPLYLRGQSKIYPEAEPGQIIKKLRQVKTKNPVILLDEIDRVADDSLNTIMGVLVELLDPEQNSHFSDHFIDYPFDLSEAIFVATANHTRRIATAVLDRLEVLQMPSYTDSEKVVIGREYLLPKAIEKMGLKQGELVIKEDCWPQVVRPLGYDAGVRTLNRTIEGICRKVARRIVEGQKEELIITNENVKEFLPDW